MSRMKNALAAALVLMIPGLILGLLLLLVPTDFLLKLLFVVMGVVTVLSGIPGLMVGIASFATAGGKFSLVVSLISMIVGFLMIFHHSELLMIILGVYMIALPIINVLLAKDHLAQLKAELPKMIIGLLLLLLGPAQTLDILFRVAGWALIGVSVILAAIVLIRGAKAPKASPAAGSYIFVDKNGDGTVDAVFVDTTGDGKPDTEIEYREEK